MSNLLGEYGVEASDVAVLTPYVAQKARIKSILKERVEDWKKAPNKTKKKNLGNLQHIRVQTITESQGIFCVVALSVFGFVNSKPQLNSLVQYQCSCEVYKLYICT